jgi:hypothetical protein
MGLKKTIRCLTLISTVWKLYNALVSGVGGGGGIQHTSVSTFLGKVNRIRNLSKAQNAALFLL